MINPITVNYITCSKVNFKSGCPSYQVIKPPVDTFKHKKPHLRKIPVISSVIGFIANLAGSKIHYNDLGQLKSIEKYKQGLLKEVRTFTAESNKLKEADEYENGQLSRITSFSDNSNCVSYICEYNDNLTITTSYYPDGITKKEIIRETEHNNEENISDTTTEITKYAPDGMLKSVSNYINDSLRNERLYTTNSETYNIYENGIIKASRKTHYNGKIGFSTTDYDSFGKKIQTRYYNTERRGDLDSIVDYIDDKTRKYTKLDKKQNVIFTEIIDVITGARKRTYTSKGAKNYYENMEAHKS